MRTLYFNCKTGISGDMVVGSLLDLGINPGFLSSELEKLPLNGYKITARKINKLGVPATKFGVLVSGKQEERHLPEILEIIEESSLDKETKKLSKNIFLTLAEAEAIAHNTTIDVIHFHEIGAVDSIIDIVSASILIKKLGIKKAYCGTISLGCGKTETAHGMLSVPTPAVRLLLEKYPTIRTEIETELTTPTGAAIIKTIAEHKKEISGSGIKGFGAGTKDLYVPNVLETVLIT